MKYEAEFSKTFLKNHKKLSHQTKNRIKQNIKQILINPYIGIPLIGNLRGLWKGRVGKYRIIYEIHNRNKIVIFHDVGLRKGIYKP